MKRRRRSGGVEGQRAVKRACVDAGFGLAPRVVGWEVFGSPERKIVTRSSRGGEEMVELEGNEEDSGLLARVEEQDEEGDVTVEILDEEGRVVGVEDGDDARDAGWEDEDADDDDSGTGDDEQASTSGMSPSSMLEEKATPNAVFEPSYADANGNIQEETHEEDTSNAGASPEDGHINLLDAQHGSISILQDARRLQLAREREESLVLPDGFVSPVKRPMARIGKLRSMAARRRTLPMQFAPAMSAETFSTLAGDGQAMDRADVVERDSISANDESLEVEIADTDEPTVLDSVEDASGPHDQEWEDVETSESEVDAMEPEDGSPTVVEAPGDTEDDRTIADGFVLNHLDIHDDDTTPTKLPSSPIPSIEGPHPRLPLRRSPRRKSSSPLKQSTILPSTEKPHLVAFTPLKSIFSFSMPLSEDTSTQDPPMSSPIERSASAPPEEPSISPRKPSRPRVSDDTALLQAFLNRAAESKGISSTNSRISVSKRESLSNRRDSDAVRHALASPAKPEAGSNVHVLGELDVNSPSPRKTASLFSSAGITTEANIFDNVIAEAADKAEDESARGDSEDDGGSRTRRSGRTSAKKNSQFSTVSTAQPPTAANRISIRAPNGEGRVVLKRSDAQELALLTRNNTRKNKGGAILPPLRLTKMALIFGMQAADGSQVDDTEDAGQGTGKKSKKGVKWAEQLVEFQQGPTGDMSDSSVLSDELSASTTDDHAGEEQDKKGDKVGSSSSIASSAVAPPPAETPSKPKIRRLKAPRTAATSTPGKAPSPPASTTPASDPTPPATAEKSNPKPSLPQPTTKRRSRIATPAKGLLSSSLLPSDLDPQPVVPAPPPTSQPQQEQRKRKAPISKLPAPSSTSLSNPTTSSIVGQGKENVAAASTSLLLSPPKKKAAPTAKAAFAPKLDFGSGPKMPRGDSAGDEQIPGLMSPAKKGGRTARMLGPVGDEGGRRDVEAEMPMGLRSPAKKRTRRAM